MRPNLSLRKQQELEYLRRNAPFMNREVLARALAVRKETLSTTCRQAEIELMPEGAPSRITRRMSKIAGFANSVPEGTELRHWKRGTALRAPADQPGYLSVTWHFADDGDDGEQD